VGVGVGFVRRVAFPGCESRPESVGVVDGEETGNRGIGREAVDGLRPSELHAPPLTGFGWEPDPVPDRRATHHTANLVPPPTPHSLPNQISNHSILTRP